MQGRVQIQMSMEYILCIYVITDLSLDFETSASEMKH
jgi:hypothetical protein